MVTYFQLVELGMGNYKEVQELDARTVIQCLAYEQFKSEYQTTYLEINKS
jgi:hypothetical protein